MRGKWFLFSRTIIGILITVVFATLKLLEIDLGFGEENVQNLVTYGFEMIGASLAIYGRGKATAPITFAPPKATP